MSEHSPHDAVQPRVEEERQQTDMVDGNLVATLSTRTRLPLYNTVSPSVFLHYILEELTNLNENCSKYSRQIGLNNSSIC